MNVLGSCRMLPVKWSVSYAEVRGNGDGTSVVLDVFLEIERHSSCSNCEEKRSAFLRYVIAMITMLGC